MGLDVGQSVAQWQDAADAWHRWGPLLGTWLGSTIGIVGLGSIGLCVAERAAAFGMRRETPLFTPPAAAA